MVRTECLSHHNQFAKAFHCNKSLATCLALAFFPCLYLNRSSSENAPVLCCNFFIIGASCLWLYFFDSPETKCSFRVSQSSKPLVPKHLVCRQSFGAKSPIHFFKIPFARV
ncbi:hypothetical protein AVEN_125931-1 [Araneus ventricosus]|uniref:Uncharacterized protein n=1 Tax=Araneus ventricosus TaxID=182803 RepID=A0A4Y2QQT3_ARAVE|nr:hypothetical protein AVEN_125931-1 [Araneus ventricosus]